MGIPQLILIILYALSLGINLSEHGKPKKGTYSFPMSVVSTVLVFGLLIWGGFFK